MKYGCETQWGRHQPILWPEGEQARFSTSAASRFRSRRCVQRFAMTMLQGDALPAQMKGQSFLEFPEMRQ